MVKGSVQSEKLRILKWGDYYLRLSGWARCNHKCPYKRGIKGVVTTEEGNVRMVPRGGKDDGMHSHDPRDKKSP